jgi:hypothetical protein
VAVVAVEVLLLVLLMLFPDSYYQLLLLERKAGHHLTGRCLLQLVELMQLH